MSKAPLVTTVSDEMIARIDRTMSGTWQQMETAPLDGSPCLIFSEGEVLTGYFDDGCDDEGEPCDDAGWFWYDKNETGPAEPMLWMAFPKPPHSEFRN